MHVHSIEFHNAERMLYIGVQSITEEKYVIFIEHYTN